MFCIWTLKMINLPSLSIWHTFNSQSKFSFTTRDYEVPHSLLFTSIMTPLLCSDPWLNKTSPLLVISMLIQPSKKLYVSWTNLISDLLLTNQLKMAFLYSIDRIPRTFKDNSLKFKLSFIVTYFNFWRKQRKGGRRYIWNLHVFLFIKSRPQKINNTKITRKKQTKNNNSHKEPTQYLKIKYRPAKAANCATFDWHLAIFDLNYWHSREMVFAPQFLAKKKKKLQLWIVREYMRPKWFF